MKWTTAKPTSPGWYWLDQRGDFIPCMAFVSASKLGLQCEILGYEFGQGLALMPDWYLWSSEPIPLPEGEA